MSYKRNQIEEAISRLFDPKSKEVPQELRTRIKRLFELDRSLGRSLRSKDPEQAHYAFFSDETPGTGADILFSEYDGFALLNGLRLMGHGWPQGFAVSTMRRLRLDLEKEHARILKQNPDELFNEQEIRKNAQPGDIAVDNTDPVFLRGAVLAWRDAPPTRTTNGDRPRKRFGQHFLEPAWVAKLIDALDAGADDTFLEIGPGRGALTRPLAAARRARRRRRNRPRPCGGASGASCRRHVRVVAGRLPRRRPRDAAPRRATPARVVGNLPYNVSSPILFKLLARGRRRAAVQRRHADAAEGSRRPAGGAARHGATTARSPSRWRCWPTSSALLTLPPGAFRPPPKVTSAVVRLRFRPPAADVGDPAAFERLVRGVFLQRRKTLLNALKPVADVARPLGARNCIERAG